MVSFYVSTAAHLRHLECYKTDMPGYYFCQVWNAKLQQLLHLHATLMGHQSWPKQTVKKLYMEYLYKNYFSYVFPPKLASFQFNSQVNMFYGIGFQCHLKQLFTIVAIIPKV